MSLSIKVSVLLSLILFFSLSLSAALGYVKFEKALSGVIFSRQHVTIRSLADNIETGLNLGLTLAEIQNFRPLVERAAHEHPDLLLAEVVDIAGHQIFMLGDTSILPTRTWDARGVPASGWRKIGSSTIALAEPLFNSFGQRVGIIIIEFSRSGMDRTLTGISDFTRKIFLSVTAGGAVLCLIISQLLRGPLNRAIEKVEAQLYNAQASTAQAPSADASPADASGQTSTESSVDCAVRVRSLTSDVENDIRTISEKFHNDRA